jgi:exosortase N
MGLIFRQINSHFGFLVLYVIMLVYISARGYFHFNATVGLGFLMLPYVWTSGAVRNTSNRWFWLVIPLLLACWKLEVITLYYWLAIAALIWVIESFYARMTLLPVSLLFVISLLFRYLSEVFTFPIRIWLSKSVGVILKFCQVNVQVSGNNLVLNGEDFVVAPACMGLEMMGVSLLMAIFLMAYYQKNTQKILGDIWILGILILSFGINVINNFFRIILLILLKIAPENPFHEVMGLVCFFVYVCLPIYYIIPKVVSRFGKTNDFINSSTPVSSSKMVLHLFVCLMICFTIVTRIEQIKTVQNTLSTTNLNHFQVEQRRTKEALIYVKNIPAFYSVEHSPLFCWTGSGYELNNIDEKRIENHTIYTGILKKGKEQLRTAWWFTNGKVQTVSQLEWRWVSFLENSPFKLINVTAETEKGLMVEVGREIIK